MNDPQVSVSRDAARRGVLLPDDHVLGVDDAELVAFLLGGRNFSYSVAPDGELTWGAFGTAFRTLGELRVVAQNVPADVAPLAVELASEGEAAVELPVLDAATSETVGLELFANMLDTIAFLRVRLRALADVVIEKGLVSGPELLGRYHEYHERSFQAFRDQMLLKPDIFETRFGEWLATEKAYRDRLAADGRESDPEP